MKQTKRYYSNFCRSYRKTIISTFTMLMICFYTWLTIEVTTINFPNAGQPTLLYSTENKNNLGQTLAKAIVNAKKTITLVIYTLTDRNIIEKLNAKSLEGATITIICDAMANPNIQEKLSPSIKLVKRFLMGLMHQKILIIDDKQTWIGSANMTSESLHHYGNLIAAIESEPLAAMATAKAHSLQAHNRAATFPTCTFPIGEQSMELWFLPDNKNAITRIQQLIQSAKKTIRIAMFTWTRYDLANAVIAAKDRGIKVEVVIDKGTAAGASEKVVKLLKKNNVAVRTNKGAALLHHKFMCIDEEILINGSANWTLQAFEKNDDCFIVLKDLNSEQIKFLETMWKTILSSSSEQR